MLLRSPVLLRKTFSFCGLRLRVQAGLVLGHACSGSAAPGPLTFSRVPRGGLPTAPNDHSGCSLLAPGSRFRESLAADIGTLLLSAFLRASFVSLLIPEAKDRDF